MFENLALVFSFCNPYRFASCLLHHLCALGFIGRIAACLAWTHHPWLCKSSAVTSDMKLLGASQHRKHDMLRSALTLSDIPEITRGRLLALHSRGPHLSLTVQLPGSSPQAMEMGFPSRCQADRTVPSLGPGSHGRRCPLPQGTCRSLQAESSQRPQTV